MTSIKTYGPIYLRREYLVLTLSAGLSGIISFLGVFSIFTVHVKTVTARVGRRTGTTHFAIVHII